MEAPSGRASRFFQQVEVVHLKYCLENSQFSADLVTTEFSMNSSFEEENSKGIKIATIKPIEQSKFLEFQMFFFFFFSVQLKKKD